MVINYIYFNVLPTYITGLANIENQSAIQSILDTQPVTESAATQGMIDLKC